MPKPISLTKLQADILSFVYERKKRTGASPLYREIQERFAMRSPQQVNRILEALQDKGYIQREFRRRHGITILKPPPNAPDGQVHVSSALERAAYARGVKEGRRQVYDEIKAGKAPRRTEPMFEGETLRLDKG